MAGLDAGDIVVARWSPFRKTSDMSGPEFSKAGRGVGLTEFSVLYSLT